MGETPDTPHEAMLREIEAEARVTASYTGRPAFSRRVMEALARVKREAFVSPSQESAAYVNGPLPIGYGQTISQPFIVALMTDLADLEPEHVVLEIGTGSGYQTAILAELVREVYTIEMIPELATQARERLSRLGYENVHLRSGDGNAGWPEHAPYDAILVTAAAPRVPPALVEQLKPGGRMIIPIGAWPSGQDLIIIEKDGFGETRQRAVLPVAFVPLVGGERRPGKGDRSPS